MSSDVEVGAKDLRHKFSHSELNRFRKMSNESLKTTIQEHIASDNFGKALVFLEILVSKMNEQDSEFFKTRFQLAAVCSVVDESKKSLPIWESLLKEARKTRPETLPDVLFNYGGALVDEENFDKAQELLDEGYALAQTAANDVLQATILQELSLIDRARDNFDKAEIRLREALLLRKQQEEIYEIGICLIHLAEVIEAQNRTEEAEKAYMEALDFAKKHDDLSDERVLLEERLHEE